MYSYTVKITQNNDILVINEDRTEISAKELLKSIPTSRVFAFYGEMGVGKTTFIQWLCKGLGVKDSVNSPTFAIVNVYERKNNITHQTDEIYHFDCYRLNNKQEAIDLGAEEYIYSGNYCFIEWPEIMEDILPDDTTSIIIKLKDNGDRVLTID